LFDLFKCGFETTKKVEKMATSKQQDQASHVREFTIGAGQPCPDRPEVMTKEEVEFISKMILDEVMELMATVAAPEDAKASLKSMIDKSKDIPKTTYVEGEKGRISQIADQADALVDIEYYMLNSACKKGVNLSSLFGVVHAANMAKRDPSTGKFIKRDDGKIIKPVGWQPPDIDAEIERQTREGAWDVDGKEN
jgi:predicted HAD superfamily Cof-like phosphohydrolase